MFKFNHESHKRFNPLTCEWILVSPNRLNRPWQGKIESREQANLPAYDPACYLCPNNTRANGTQNPDYKSTFVFNNDFPVFTPDGNQDDYREKDILFAKREKGISRVVCYSPRHNLSLSRMSIDEIRIIVDTWVEKCIELSSRKQIRYIQIFENRGEMMGCSNPHPHGQIWASESIPNEINKEDTSQSEYINFRTTSGLLSDYIKIEMRLNERIVAFNDSWIALIPFWATWPFETLLIPFLHSPNLLHLNDYQKRGLAEILKEITTRYDNLFQSPFPYTMGFHQSPNGRDYEKYWHLHAHFYPPLLRSATIKKHMVGFEMLCEPQRDFTPEEAAERLRSLPIRNENYPI